MKYKTLKDECDRLLEKYPDRIPCIVIYDEKLFYPDNKMRYLVPRKLTFGEFVYIIRKNLKIYNTQSLFVFTKNTLVPSSMTVSEVYEKHKDSNGILFCTASLENTFGN